MGQSYKAGEKWGALQDFGEMLAGGAVAWTKMVAMDVVKSGYILERYSVRFPDRLQ